MLKFAKIITKRIRLFSLRDSLNFPVFNFKINLSKNMNTKPPNILVYTGTNNSDRFKEVEVNLSKCLQIDSYLFYHLLPSEVKKNPWMENSILLIVSSDTVENSILSAFEAYLKKFGNILWICCNINSPFSGVTCSEVAKENKLIHFNFKNMGRVHLFRGKYFYHSEGVVLCKDLNDKPLIQKITENNMLITSEVYLDRNLDFSSNLNEYDGNNHLSILKYILTEEFELEANTDNVLPELSSGYLLCKDDLKPANISKLQKNATGDFIFHDCKFSNFEEEICRPIYFSPSKSFPFLNFNKDLYFSRLYSDAYGHQLVYFPVTTSTMDVAEQLSESNGIVIAAGRQIKGKGRRGNKWISPEGCAMFTLHFTVKLDSHLGKKLTLLQHMASLAVIQGIKNQEGYKDLELKIKWPNDIYYNKIKVGGLIVSTVIQRDLAHIYIGWGINVANKRPTTCINNAIDEFNFQNESSLPHLHIEEVIAFTVAQMEYYVKDFIESGPEMFLKDYYSNWMHSNQRVTHTDANQNGIIIGLDEYGFLKIRLDNGETLVFQPDGNRFDIMKNLIHTI